MFPDMYFQYNHPTSKSQQKPFDKNRHPHSIHHSADVNSPHNASSAAPMPHIPPSDHKETQPLQPSSAALMAHHLPSDHSIPTHPKKSLTQNTPSAENTPLNTTNIPNKGYSLYIQHKLPTQSPHKLITPTTNAQDGLPEGRLHGRDPVRRSKPLVILGAWGF